MKNKQKSQQQQTLQQTTKQHKQENTGQQHWGTHIRQTGKTESMR